MIISIAIEKGGTGKSQTAVNLSTGLAKYYGQRVLVVDLDPQGTASLGFGFSPLERKTHAIHEVLSGEISPDKALYAYNKELDLYIIPSRHELAVYGTREFTSELSQILDPLVDQFDQIIIDLPPTLGNFTATALVLSDLVLIPVNAASSVCIVALISQIKTIKTIAETVNEKLAILGILPCMVNNTRICTEVLTWLEEEYADLLFETRIRHNVKLAESLGLGEPIFYYSPESYGALDYKALAGEVLRRLRSGAFT